MILQTSYHHLALAPASRSMITAATVAKVIGPCKRVPRRRLAPSRREYDRQRHSALREIAVARSHTDSASLVHAAVSDPIDLLYQTISREQLSGP